MLEAVLPPLVVGYALFLLMTLAWARRPVPRPPPGSGWLGPRRRGVVRHVAVTVFGGYVVFLGIVAVFHTWLASEPGALASALLEGSALALGVFGLFGVLLWVSPPRRPRAR